MSSSVSELWRWCGYLSIKCTILPKSPLILQTPVARILFHSFLISFCISEVFVNHTQLNKWKWCAKIIIFTISIRLWSKRDINIRICSGTVDKWHNTVVTYLTHWGRVMHICVGNLTVNGSDNGLSPGRRQAINLNQCWDIINWTLRNKLQWNFNRNNHTFIQENVFESVVCEMAAIFSRPQYINMACVLPRIVL